MVISNAFKHDDVLGLKFGYQPIGKPSLYTHIYFIDGLLIDTGQRKAQKSILAEVQKLEVDQMFITHHHEDHSGNIVEIRELFSCDAFASELCCQMMKDPPEISLAQKLTWGDRESYDELIPKKDSIETPKFNFQIIPIPGHADDMVALYEPDMGWLFSADLYINSYIDYFLENESMQEQINSIQKILKLDFNEMFCSHKPQLTNGKRQLTKKLGFLESFFGDVSTLYQKGYSSSGIFKELGLKENWFVKFLSGGKLSKLNMVKSVIRDIDEKRI